MGLRHGQLGAVEAVEDQFTEKAEAHLAGHVEEVLAAVVDEDDRVAPPVRAHVDVFAQLDVASGAEDDRAAVAPGTEAVGGEPVDADVVGGAVVAQERCLAKIIEAGRVVIGKVADGGMNDSGVPRAAVEQELFELVAADVAEDAAVLDPVEEPGGARRLAQPVGAEAKDLDDAADRAAVHEVARVQGALHMQAFAVIHHVLPTGGGGDGAGARQLIQRGERRLVGKIVLARLHHPAAERSAVARHGGRRDQAHLRVGEDLVERARHPDLGVLRAEGVNLGRVRIENPFQAGAGFEQSVALAVDVAVIEVRGGEQKRPSWHDRSGPALRGKVHAIGFLAHRIGHGCRWPVIGPWPPPASASSGRAVRAAAWRASLCPSDR